MVAKHHLVLCVFYFSCGEVVMNLLRKRNYRFKNEGAFSRLTLVLSRTIDWIAPGPSIQAKFQLRTPSFYRLKFYLVLLILKRWTLQWYELTGVFLRVSRHSVPLSEKLQKLSRGYTKLTSRKIKNTKTGGENPKRLFMKEFANSS